ncbi:hypothetical protein KAR48_08630 [bacterium]|nr:hypothetical protein [bacterium]
MFKKSGKFLACTVIVIWAALITGCSQFENPMASEDSELDTGSMAKASAVFNAVDDIMLLDENGRIQIYEDAEDGLINNWWMNPEASGAFLQNNYDPDRGSRVIELFDMGTTTGFILTDGDGPGTFWNYSWNNTSKKFIQFSVKFNVDFVVWVVVSTDKGNRWLEYTPEDVSRGLKVLPEPYTYMSNKVHTGLGSDIVDGQWHTITRDLQADLIADGAGLDEEIYAIRLFKIRGYSTNTPPPPPVICDAHTIGFWKNNIKKVILQDRTNGTQLTRDQLIQYLDVVQSFDKTPFNGISFKSAYSIMNYHGSDAISLLKKQLLASEFNYAAGAYINGDEALTADFLMAGEAMILNPGSRDEILELQQKFDAYNNGSCDVWQ